MRKKIMLINVMLNKVMLLFISVLLIMNCSTTNQVKANEDHNKFNDEALILKELSLFQGTNNGFELDRYATRVEAGIIVVRLLGLEQEAFEMEYEHPFSDVPTWASDHIGLLYHYNLTSGYGGTIYGAFDTVTPEQFLTFCLRVLEYDDEAGDFYWRDSLGFATDIELIDTQYKNYLSQYPGIYRDDIIAVLFNLLNQKMKLTEEGLIDRLINKQVFTKQKAIELGVYRQPHIFSVMTTVLEIGYSMKPLIIDYRNNVGYIVTVPFTSGEQSYISYLRVEDDEGIQYQCFIPFDVYLQGDDFDEIDVGTEYHAYGELVVHMVQDDVNIEMLILEK